MHLKTTRSVIKHGGTVVEDYAQGDDERISRDSLTAGGWCLGVSIHWLRLLKQGGDFSSWIDSQEAEKQLRFIMAAQGAKQLIIDHLAAIKPFKRERAPVVLTNKAHNDFVGRSFKELKKYGFQFMGNGEWFQLNSFATPFNFEPLDGQSWGYILHLWKVTNGGHTIAIYRDRDGDVTVMDPNFGAIRFPHVDGMIDFMDEMGWNPGFHYFPIKKLILEEYRFV